MYVLPEVPVEASAETHDNKSADDVEGTPALPDRLLEVGGEGDGIYLFLAGSRREQGNSIDEHKQEYKQPALEDEPVGLPEPSGIIPE